MSDFGQRIKELREKFKLTQQEFADIIGAGNKQTISDVENGKQKSLKNVQVSIILDKYKVSKTWLLLGEGPMLIEEATVSQSIIGNRNNQINGSNNIVPGECDPSKFVAVPIMSAKAGAGSTGPAHYEVYTQGELMIDRILFRVLPNLKNVRAIEVDGDSMRPTLNEGDFVIIEENSAFSGEGIYVLQYDGVLLVKRLQPDFDGIEILSDNPNYKTRKFNPSDDQSPFHIVGKVILKVQR